ncbi:MAG: hypothetical protein ACYDCN_06280 [Bacteroidia bacterium]
MINSIEPKDDYTTDELYIIYNSIDLSKERADIVAKILFFNTEEEKEKSYKENLLMKLWLSMKQYKAKATYLDIETKTGYIQEELSKKLIPQKNSVGTIEEGIGYASERSADRLYKKFLTAELDKSEPKLFEPEDELKFEIPYITSKNILEIDIERLFHSIKECTITEIDIYNTVKKLTDDFKIEALELLLNDFSFFVFLERDRHEGKYTSVDIERAVQDLEKRGLEIPYYYHWDLSKDKDGKIIKTLNGEKSIDIEKLLYPSDFFGCDRFEALLKRLIKKDYSINEEKPNDIQTPTNKYPKIFLNGYAYEFFERLRSEIATNKHNYANYSFIMQKMITADFLIQTNHSKLIQFLDKEYKTDIGKNYIQFKVSTANNKKDIYTRLFKEFQPKINSIL